MNDLTLQQAARRQGLIVLALDQDGAEFYIEMFHDYNSGRKPRDEAVADDENYLRRECEILYGDDIT